MTESADLDTVLGLSLTPTTAGWVLVDGHDADGAILDHDHVQVRDGGGVRVVQTSEQMAAAVLDAQAIAAGRDRRLHLVGLTWSDDAAAEATLLVEALTSAGFDNVVPVRRLEAVDALARGIAPVTGYEKTAVCVLDRRSASVVLVGTSGGAMRTTVKRVPDGPGGLVAWLAAMFDRSRWRPESVVVVGSGPELDTLATQLEIALAVPVLTQPGAQSALARGAALATVRHTQFSDAREFATRTEPPAGQVRSRSRSYAGGLTMLGAGAATLVASLSLAVGLQVVPHGDDGSVAPAIHTSPTPSAADAVAPPPVPAAPAAPPAPSAEAGTAAARTAREHAPAPAEGPAAPQAGEPPAEPTEQPPAGVPAADLAAPPPQQPSAPAQPGERPPLLTRLLERLHGFHDN